MMGGVHARRLLAASLALTLLTLGAAERAEAYCLMTTVQTEPTVEDPCPMEGIPLAWTGPCISYAIDERDLDADFVDDFRTAAEIAFTTWEEVDCGSGTTGIMAMQLAEPSLCADAQFSNGGGNVNTIAFVDNWAEREYSRTAFAVTTVWHRVQTGEILDTDILINEAQGPYALCPDTGCPLDVESGRRVVDIHGLLTHETGHVYGISHSQDPNATMYATAARGALDLRDLAIDDEEALCANYPSGSLDSTCDFTPEGGLDLECTYAPPSSGDGGRCGVSPGASPSPLPWLLALGLAPVVALRRRRAPRRG